jgi:hypothetical protein
MCECRVRQSNHGEIDGVSRNEWLGRVSKDPAQYVEDHRTENELESGDRSLVSHVVGREGELKGLEQSQRLSVGRCTGQIVDNVTIT